MNALLYGVSNDKLRKLQSVQHSAARLIFKKKKSEHVTPLLRSLHWLPVEHRINYKINLLTFKAIHGEAPLYLQELVQPYQPARHLRSTTQGQLTRKDTAKTGKRTGGRAFAVSAVLLWNNLSPNVKTHVVVLCPAQTAPPKIRQETRKGSIHYIHINIKFNI